MQVPWQHFLVDAHLFVQLPQWLSLQFTFTHFVPVKAQQVSKFSHLLPHAPQASSEVSRFKHLLSVAQ
jgi:hypothetical protein